MEDVMNRKLTLLGLALLLAFALVGCSSDDPASPAATTEVTAVTDAAEAVAADLGDDNGGLVDQLSDAVAAVETLGAAKDMMDNPFSESVYDDVTGTWTITVDRERTSPSGNHSATIHRIYTMRFLDADGLPMMYRVVDGDTARTVEFDILEGTGSHVNRRLSRTLNSLEGSFVIEGVNTDMVTVNGTYARTATHHLETPVFSRTMDGALSLELIDVVLPRAARRNLDLAVSGTLTGTITATITVERGDEYLERTIDQSFTVILGDGEGALTMGGQQFRTNLCYGELIDE
jgi:hypothetical protein